MRNGIARKERRPQREPDEPVVAAKAAPRPMPEGRKTFFISLGCSLLGGLILWIAFPPLNLWPIAWLAPLPWLYLILRPQPMTRWGYFGIWVGGFVHWLLMLYGIALAHVLLVAGWILLAAYLAVYLPLFIGLCRLAVQRLRISVVFAAPVVWVGLELARGYIVTGFSAGLLSHTQTDLPALLQIADIFGAYGVSFVMMLVAACVGKILYASRVFSGATSSSGEQNGRTIAHDLATMFGPLATYWSAPVAILALTATLIYGFVRLTEQHPGKESDKLTVALIQGSRDVHINMALANAQERMDHYVDLTDEARRKNAVLDLVIWPESMFFLPEINLAQPYFSPNSEIQVRQEEFRSSIDELVKALNSNTDSIEYAPTRFWFCTTTVVLGERKPTFYNTAILVDENGQIVSRYHKMHGVMFGEYVPFGGWFPGIYDVVPIEGMTEGNQAAAATVKGWTFCPSICFESTVPHLIRSQVLELEKKGTRPDVLVNLTNDGWFYGSSILDLHLKCSVFRAIENRRPMLIAANTGISAHIDGNGRVLLRGPKRRSQVLVATVQPDGRRPLYLLIGDLPALACTAVCGLLMGIGLLRRPAKKPGIVSPAVNESIRNEPGS